MPVRAISRKDIRRWRISCLIEYEYKGSQSPLVEVGKCLDYTRQALV